MSLYIAMITSPIEVQMRIGSILGGIFGREYYSYKIDIIPKMEYNVLEREVYSLCI